MKSILYILCALVVSTGNGIPKETPANDANSKTVIINIPTGSLPPASAEEVVPKHPFFAESIGAEAMEKLTELEERIEKLEKKVSLLEKEKH